jgi:hypothetical protein
MSPEIPTSEPAYIAKVKTAAPEQIVRKASIIIMQAGKSRELQAGSNGFTCLISADGTPQCADQNAMEWINSIGARTDPPDNRIAARTTVLATAYRAHPERFPAPSRTSSIPPPPSPLAHAAAFA